MSVKSLLDAQKDRIAALEERLDLIAKAASDFTDGDSQLHDTHYAEIGGIAEGDPDWLQHARANYGTK